MTPQPPRAPEWYTRATIGATIAFLIGLALCLWAAPRPQKAQAVSTPPDANLPLTTPGRH
ncbi:MAG: hypothetical protein NTV86_15215 [Planctomycetota bacterium]|nr:hypothetical protein [Planctomycetota bacterium]